MASLARATGRPFPSLQDAPLLAALTGAYVVAGKLGLRLAFEHPSASPVWPPAGIALAALLILGPRVWPAVSLGAFLVNVTTAGALGTSLGIAAGNTLEAVLGAWLVTRFANGRRAFDSTRDMLRFVLLAGLLSPVASASVGVASLALGGHADTGRFASIWLTWWLGDAVGALVVAPVLLIWHSNPRVRWKRREALEAVLWLALFVLVGLVFFSGFTPSEYRQYLRPFPLMPLLILMSIRFGTREAATGLSLLSGFAIWGTLRGFGPFVLPTPNESLLLLQAFLGMTAVLTLAAAVMIAERRRAERRLQAFFDQAVVGIADCDLDGRLLRVNQRFCEMLGYTREELFARSVLDITHPDDRAATQVLLQRLKAEGTPYTVDKRYVRSDGTSLWVRTTVSRVVAEPAQTAHAASVVEDITERKQVEEATRKAAALEERSRLAAEIHDNLAQSFVGIVMQLENEAEASTDRKSARQHIAQATRLARAALQQAQRSSQSLRPQALEAEDLPAALRAAAAGLFAGTEVALEFRCDGTLARLAPEIEEDVFYIAKEALTNAWWHGAPSKLICHLQYGAGELHVRVTDDGRGFDVNRALHAGRFGLTNMQERARRIGASLSIESDPGQGTSVLLRLPLPA
jgi:PAS domain S-box-containing protein